MVVKKMIPEHNIIMDKMVKNIRESLWPEKDILCPCFITINDVIFELVIDIQRVYKVTEQQNLYITKIQEFYPYLGEVEEYFDEYAKVQEADSRRI
jgi:hypothetical protein